MRTFNSMRGASVIAAMLVGVWASSAQANLVLNGGFDTGDFTDWTLFTTPNGSLGPSPQVVSFDVTGGGASNAAEFEVGEVIFTNLQEGGGIQQTITTAAGIAVMHVDIAAFNISGSPNAQGGVFTLLLDGVPLDSFTTGFIADGATIRDSLDFTGAITAGNHVLAVQITRDFQNGGFGQTPFEYIDNVSLDVRAAPEPATLALLSLGLAGLGFSRRRKSN